MSVVNRRSFLRGSAGAAIALPWLESAPARAATTRPQRFIVMTSVLGTFPEKFWPRPVGSAPWARDHRPNRSYTTGEVPLDTTSFQLEAITKPLERHQRDLLFVEGLDRTNCSGHGGYCNMLSGVKPIVQGDETGGGITLDQIIANAIGGDTKFPSVQLGVQCSGTGKYACLSWYGAQKPAPAEPNPLAVFARLFAEVPGSQADTSALEALAAERRSVLDAALAQAKALQPRVSSADRQKLQGYLDSVRQVEERLTMMSKALGCTKPASPTIGANPKELSSAVTPSIAEAQIDLLAMAFACDLTRVATLQFGHEGSNQTHPWLNVDIRHHDLSHTKPDATDYVENYDAIARIGAWHATQLATLIDKLKAIPEGDGTVWDNTMIVWLNGLTWGCFHSDERSPVLLAGSAGGRFKTGRHIRYARPKGVPVPTFNDLFAEVQRAYGIDATGFGDPAFRGRSLANLAG